MLKIIIHLDKILQNLNVAQKLSQTCNIELVVVTKCCGTDKAIIERMLDAGLKAIAESHPANFGWLKNRAARTVFSAPLSVLKEHPVYDFIHVTELKFLDKLSTSPLPEPQKIIIPVECGDLREGVPPSHLIPFMKRALEIRNIEIAGFSANFGCFTHFTPDIDRIRTFVECIRQAAAALQFEPQILSIGGSSLWSLLRRNQIPEEITQIRLGEAIFLGTDPGLCEKIGELSQDTFILESEIIEIKDKPIDSKHVFDCNPVIDSAGTEKERMRRQAVLDIGYITCPHGGLTPLQKGVKIVGSSQDHTVVDITAAKSPLTAGDSIQFRINYEALCRAMINPYLTRVYVS